MMKPTRSWSTGLGLKTLATMLLSALLVSCGSSSKYDEFIPTRIVSAGDGMSYLTAAPSPAVAPLTPLGAYANMFTVIEENANSGGNYDHWLKQFAAGYGLTTIGNSLNGSAQIVTLTNQAPTPRRTNPADVTITNIRAQLTGISTRADDLLVLSVGVGDILSLSEGFIAGTYTETQAKAEARSRGRDYMDLANQLYQNGTFRRIILLSPPDISNSPYARNALVAGVSSLISEMSDEFIYGIKRNASTYPRDGGIWFFDTTNLLRNINTATGLNVNLTTPVCDEANVYLLISPPQLCSVRTGDADTLAGRTSNSNSLLERTTILPFSNTSGTSLYSSNLYFFAGSVFPTPAIHRYIGSALYNRMRSTIGF
jgi:hypothetical protein